VREVATQINILTVMKLYFQVLLHGDSRRVQQMCGFISLLIINLAKDKTWCPI